LTTGHQLSDQDNDRQMSETVCLEDQIQLLGKVITQLKPDQEQCIRLFFLEQKSYEQIMSQTNYSFKEVKSHLQNGKRNLRILMEQNLKNESN
jgi:RNA polymerase sigma-70 factor (ECF subfamily)